MNLSLRLTPWSPALALLIPLGWLGCESVSATKLEESSPAQKSAMTQVELHGSVHYLERMMLPPGATLTVSLQDVSLQDVAATKIATDTQTLEGGPP
jgi:putative lipoprotein